MKTNFFIVAGTSVLSIAATLLVVYFYPLSSTQPFRFRPAVYSVGDTIIQDGLSFRVIEVTRTNGSAQLPAPSGSTYLVTKVVIGNNSGQPVQMIPLLHFHAKDDQGRVFDVTPNPSNSAQLSGLLVDGDTLQEEVSFLIPADARGMHFLYEPGIGDQRVIRIALENV